MKRIIYIITGCLYLLTACSDVKTEKFKPTDNRDDRENRHGSLIGGDQKGFSLLGGRPDEETAAGSSITVNSFLWRATLDTLAFMPLASADPFGGVIITDWYEDPKTPGERFKVNALILDRNLRADGVKVTVFKQALDKSGAWRNTDIDPSLERSLEDTILTRARQLKVAQLGK